MVWRVTNEPVDCRPYRGTNKHAQDRKRCSLLDDNSDSYIRQLQNHDYIHMTTTISYKSIFTARYSTVSFVHGVDDFHFPQCET